MDATCNHCSHWDTATPAVTDKQGFGECNELSQPKANMYYILPVVQSGDPREVEFITGAEFGCNHFAPAAEA